MATAIETVFALVDVCDDPKKVLGVFSNRNSALHALFDHELPLQFKGSVQVWVVDDLVSLIEDLCDRYTFEDCLELQDFVDEDFKRKVTPYCDEMSRLSKAREKHECRTERVRSMFQDMLEQQRDDELLTTMSSLGPSPLTMNRSNRRNINHVPF